MFRLGRDVHELENLIAEVLVPSSSSISPSPTSPTHDDDDEHETGASVTSVDPGNTSSRSN